MVGPGRLGGPEEMWNTAGLARQACAHLPDSERHGLQMCQLGGRGGEERAVNRLRLPPWGPGLEHSPSLAPAFPSVAALYTQ